MTNINDFVASDLNNEQIIALLQMLFTNMNNLDKLYYDMFINTTPLTLTLERYNEEGVLESYELPNRAKDRASILQGRGTPEGAQIASIGAMYLDILTSNLWVKTIEGGATGWVKIYTPLNFLQGVQYLAPNGDASGLTGISASSIEGGIIQPKYGGTGTGGLTGIIKGQGSELPFTTAVKGRDYAIPETMVGMLGLFMCNINDLPAGWLPANGSAFYKADYPKLADKLKPNSGTAIYPNNLLVSNGQGGLKYTDEYGTVHNCGIDQLFLPNFKNRYIRGWNNSGAIGAFQSGSVPDHRHHYNVGSFWGKDPAGWPHASWSGGDSYAGQATGYFTYASSDKSLFSKSLYSKTVNEVRVDNLSVNIAIFTGEI